MNSKVIFVSNDNDFFDFIVQKLSLRKCDEIYKFSFDNLIDKIHLFESSVVVINSNNDRTRTAELVKILKNSVVIVFDYNEDEEYKKLLISSGALDYIALDSEDSFFLSRLNQAFSLCDEKNKLSEYRQILVKNDVITKNSEVYKNYGDILEFELKRTESNSSNAVLMAIAPSDKDKFLIQPTGTETIILDNIRSGDILMTYAANKYFLYLPNTTMRAAEKLWKRISSKFQFKIYAGMTNVLTSSKEQVINDALNKLHQVISSNENKNNSGQPEKTVMNVDNFKIFKQNFEKKIEQVIIPVFYQFRQKYEQYFSNVMWNQSYKDGQFFLSLKSKNLEGGVKISYPGYAKIYIDITITKNTDSESKRIIFEPEEFEQGLLSDLLEQFVCEYRREYENEFKY